MPRHLAAPAMTPEALRAALARHGLDEDGLARMIQEAGDGTYLPWIRRRVRGWTCGANRIPPEVALAVKLMDRLAAAEAKETTNG